jgi:hypothetical protein
MQQRHDRWNYLGWKCVVAWLIAIAATVLLSSVAMDVLARHQWPARRVRDYSYGAVAILSLGISPLVGRRLRQMIEDGQTDKDKGLNELLIQNAEMLGAAFALVVAVVLLMEDLGSAFGMPNAVGPHPRMPELVGFTLAFLVTLVGRWLGTGPWRLRAAWLSCMATLTCVLALGPYFWYQRQQVTVSVVVQSAFERGHVSDSDSLGPVERMLVGASASGNYSLLQEGVNRLADTSSRCPDHESCLVRLLGYIEDDSFGRTIVARGLKTTRNARRARDSTNLEHPPDAQTGPRRPVSP